jgi:hypothetical protein
MCDLFLFLRKIGEYEVNIYGWIKDLIIFRAGKGFNKKIARNAIFIEIEEGIKRIGRRCFYKFENLIEVKFPKSLNFIGIESFAECSSLEKLDFTVCEKLDMVDNGSFRGCTSLRELIQPNRFFRYGNNVFDRCESLKKVKIPKEYCWWNYYHIQFYGFAERISI